MFVLFDNEAIPASKPITTVHPTHTVESLQFLLCSPSRFILFEATEKELLDLIDKDVVMF